MQPIAIIAGKRGDDLRGPAGALAQQNQSGSDETITGPKCGQGSHGSEVSCYNTTRRRQVEIAGSPQHGLPPTFPSPKASSLTMGCGSCFCAECQIMGGFCNPRSQGEKSLHGLQVDHSSSLSKKTRSLGDGRSNKWSESRKIEKISKSTSERPSNELIIWLLFLSVLNQK
jgi:hypothetical protein